MLLGAATTDYQEELGVTVNAEGHWSLFQRSLPDHRI